MSYSLNPWKKQRMVEMSPVHRVHGSHCPVVPYLGLVTVLCVLSHFPVL